MSDTDTKVVLMRKKYVKVNGKNHLIMRGEILEEVPTAAEDREQKKLQSYRVFKDPDIIIECRDTEVTLLGSREHWYLLAVNPPMNRIAEISKEGKTDWVMELKEGDEVMFKTSKIPSACGHIHYVGQYNKLGSGVYFGVEITSEKLRGHGTTDGRPYFQCDPNNAVWLSMDQLIHQSTPKGSKQGPSVTQRLLNYAVSAASAVETAVLGKEPVVLSCYKEGDRVVVHSLDDQRPISATVVGSEFIQLSKPDWLPATTFITMKTDTNVNADVDFPGTHANSVKSQYSKVIKANRRLCLPEYLLITEKEHKMQFRAKEDFEAKAVQLFGVRQSEIFDSVLMDVDVEEQKILLSEANAEHNSKQFLRKYMNERPAHITEPEEGAEAGSGHFQHSNVHHLPLPCDQLDEIDPVELQRQHEAMKQFEAQHQQTSSRDGYQPPDPSSHDGYQPPDPSSRHSYQPPDSSSHDGYQPPDPSSCDGYQPPDTSSRYGYHLPDPSSRDAPTISIPAEVVPPKLHYSQPAHGHDPTAAPMRSSCQSPKFNPQLSEHQYAEDRVPQYNRLYQQSDTPSWLPIDTVVVVNNSDPPLTGVVRFVGLIPGHQELIAGVELDSPMEGCTNGTFGRKRYFTCEYERGYFCCVRDLKQLADCTPPHSTTGGVGSIATSGSTGDQIMSLSREVEYLKEKLRIQSATLKQAEETKDEEKKQLESSLAEKEKALIEQKQIVAQQQDHLLALVAAKQEALSSLDRKNQEVNRLREEVNRLQAVHSRANQGSRAVVSDNDINFWVVKNSDVSLTGQLLGEGGWGRVEVGSFMGQRVAVKRLHALISNSEHYNALLCREIAMMAKVRHPNLLLFIAAVLDSPSKSPIIITELLDTSLRQAYSSGRLTKGFVKLSIMRDVAAALNYLHSQREPIIHRDVSSTNVLLQALPDNCWRAKLSDFGSANLVKDCITPGPGAMLYTAPEVLDKKAQSTKMDVFSYGILLCEVFNDQIPYEDDFPSMLQEIANQFALMHRLICSCVEAAPVKRPSMSQILNQLRQNFPRLEQQVEMETSADISFWLVSHKELYSTDEVLGEGGYGKVTVGSFRGQKVAVKQIRANTMSPPYFDFMVRREIAMMTKVRHPNLLLFIAAVLDSPSKSPIIITELLDTSLRSAYNDHHLTSDRVKLSIMRDVAAALNYLHLLKEPIIHRDVSSANVLLQALPYNSWRAKLSDFGSANLVRYAKTANQGVPAYSAPEQPCISSQQNHQFPSLDVYSYGVLLCEVYSEEFPFPQIFPNLLQSLARAHPQVHQVVTSCVEQDPTKRPSMSNVLQQLIM